jgi:predicted PurR-regulated permease PerM
MRADRERVPVRTILATIGLVLATGLVLLFLWVTAQILSWIAVALFFAVAVYPLVNWVEARARWIPRSLATLLVYLVVFLLIGGLISLFVIPIVQQGPELAKQLPGMVTDARHGRGPMGPLITRFNLDDYLREHQQQIQSYLSELGGPALGVLRGIVTGVVAIVTIFVLSYLMVLQAPKIIDATMAAIPEQHVARVRRVGSDSARTITGYLSGNLLISLIAGLLTYAVLLIMGVPFAALIALFVAVTDLIPLVGATLGAVVAIGAAFLHSTTAGIVVTIFCVVYQQAENHLLQPIIMSRTVKLNPLTVLIAVLIGVGLAGLLGALLAIPVAGVIQVIVHDLWDARRGRLREHPSEESDTPQPGEVSTGEPAD